MRSLRGIFPFGVRGKDKKTKSQNGNNLNGDMTFSDLVTLGDAANRKKNWVEAEKHYIAALKLVPKSPNIIVQLGHAIKEQGRFEEAQLLYEQALNLDPDNSDTLLQLGHCLKLLGDTALAKKYYTKSAELDGNPHAQIELDNLAEIVTFDFNHRNIDITAVYEACKVHFDYDFYYDKYTDVATAGLDALRHYIEQGCDLGYNPAPWFDTKFYLKMNTDVALSNVNPFYHYIVAGKFEGRKAILGPKGQNIALNPWETPLVLALPVSVDKSSPIPKINWAARVCVHVHCFYVEVLAEIFSKLSNIRIDFDLLLTSNESWKIDYARSHANRLQFVKLTYERIVPNRGRDVSAFLVEFGRIADDYDLVLHLHTKVSKEKREIGAAWLRHSLDGLLHDPHYVVSIINLFHADNQIGMIAPTVPKDVAPYVNWGTNKNIARDIASRIGIVWAEEMERLPDFPVGFMFWARPEAMKSILSASFGFEDFPEEPIAADGTLAHALERCILYGSEEKLVYVRPIEAEYMQPPVKSKVSIIVPAKNAVEYIHEAVQSAILQVRFGYGYSILLVDNGSTDRTKEILDYYAQHYFGVRSLLCLTEGAGAARNAGLAEVQTDYVMFLDADDILTRNAVSYLFYAISRDNVDFVTAPLCMFSRNSVSGKLPYQYGVENLSNINLIDSSEWSILDRSFVRHLFSDFGPCSKIYSTEFLKTNNIRFMEGVNYEDNYFIYSVYLLANSVSNVSDVSYLYRKNWQVTASTQSSLLDAKSLSDFIYVSRKIFHDVISVVDDVDVAYLMKEALLGRLTEMKVRFKDVLVEESDLSRKFNVVFGELSASLETSKLKYKGLT